MGEHPPTPPVRKRLPTLAEVAEVAGVSAASISRFINSPEVVAEKTAARIRDAIRQTGYTPNLLAGALASNRTRLVAVMVPSMAQSIFSTTIQAMSDALSEQGYDVLLGLGGNQDQRLSPAIDQVLGRRPDGLILTGPVADEDLRQRLLAAQIPIIQIWDIPADPLDMVVGFSHLDVGYAVGRYVIQRGYQRPFLITASGVRALSRRFGFSRAMLEHGRPEPPFVAFDAPTTVRQGRQGLAGHLEQGHRPDVIVCSSDWTAQGVYAEAQARSIRIPDDIAVIGFGDLDFAADLEPPLTTVHIDGAAIGRAAADLLLRRSRGEAPASTTVRIDFEIRQRESA